MSEGERGPYGAQQPGSLEWSTGGTAMSDGEFRITVHGTERIIEVTYPSQPTWESTRAYAEAIKHAITTMGPPWRCLVDQRENAVLDDSLADAVADLNAFAKANGMERSARVLPVRYVSRVQAERIADSGGVTGSVGLFYSRDEAWKWLITTL